MEQNKKVITSENSAEWLASCGFLFPTNQLELARFNTLYGDIDPSITGMEVDPFKIIKSSPVIFKIGTVPKSRQPRSSYDKLVARSSSKDLPDRLINKLRKGQNKEQDDNNSGK